MGVRKNQILLHEDLDGASLFDKVVVFTAGFLDKQLKRMLYPEFNGGLSVDETNRRRQALYWDQTIYERWTDLAVNYIHFLEEKASDWVRSLGQMLGEGVPTLG